MGAHVDDFVFAGREWDPRWRVVQQTMREAFTWTPWESGTLLRCNVRLPQSVDYITDVAMDHDVKDPELTPLSPQEEVQLTEGDQMLQKMYLEPTTMRWVDASYATKPDGRSAEGIFIGPTKTAMICGDEMSVLDNMGTVATFLKS